MEMRNNFFLEGITIGLRLLEENDIDGNYGSWLNDSEITAFNSHGRVPMTQEKLMNYVREVIKSNSMLVFAIIDKNTFSHIGNISLQNINWIDRNAEIAFLLGERTYWGKGVMFEAGKMVISHGFKMLNLHRIYCGTSSNNIGMQKLALKLGMTKEGIRREAIFKNGEYSDIVEFGLLRSRNEIL